MCVSVGMAMVPFADLFNHKAAVVQLGGGYFVEDVCFEGQESSDDQESEQGDSASDSDDFGSEGVQDSSDVSCAVSYWWTYSPMSCIDLLCIAVNLGVL